MVLAISLVFQSDVLTSENKKFVGKFLKISDGILKNKKQNKNCAFSPKHDLKMEIRIKPHD